MVQVVEMTHDEKKAMYMGMEKESLAEMLIEANRMLTLFIQNQKPIVVSIPQFSPEDFVVRTGTPTLPSDYTISSQP